MMAVLFLIDQVWTNIIGINSGYVDGARASIDSV